MTFDRAGRGEDLGGARGPRRIPPVLGTHASLSARDQRRQHGHPRLDTAQPARACARDCKTGRGRDRLEALTRGAADRAEDPGRGDRSANRGAPHPDVARRTHAERDASAGGWRLAHRLQRDERPRTGPQGALAPRRARLSPPRVRARPLAHRGTDRNRMPSPISRPRSRSWRRTWRSRSRPASRAATSRAPTLPGRPDDSSFVPKRTAANEERTPHPWKQTYGRAVPSSD